jgi:hypothetical protein
LPDFDIVTYSERRRGAPLPCGAPPTGAKKGLTKHYSPSPAIETQGSAVIRNFVNVSFRTAGKSYSKRLNGCPRLASIAL